MEDQIIQASEKQVDIDRRRSIRDLFFRPEIIMCRRHEKTMMSVDNVFKNTVQNNVTAHGKRKKIDDLFYIIFITIFHIGTDIISHRQCKSHHTIEIFVWKCIKAYRKKAQHNKSDRLVYFESQLIIYKQQKTDDRKDQLSVMQKIDSRQEKQNIDT